MLFVTTLSFFTFVVAIWFGAILSNSLSLLADAAAMSVDVVTYVANMVAEKLKSNAKDPVTGISSPLSSRTRFGIEVIVPVCSVSALLATGAWISYSAYEVLAMTPEEEALAEAEEASEQVNIATLYAFSSINFFVDLLSVWMFYRKGSSVFENEYTELSALHLPTQESVVDIPGNDIDAASESCISDIDNVQAYSSSSRDKLQQQHQDENNDRKSDDSPTSHKSSASTPAKSSLTLEAALTPSPTQAPVQLKNVNMMSAFMHVGADTVRTFAVFAAAAVASSGQNGARCDAWAAQVATVTVVFMALPVIKQIHTASQSLWPTLWLQEQE